MVGDVDVNLAVPSGAVKRCSPCLSVNVVVGFLKTCLK